MSTFQHVNGAWPPPTGTMLIEQDAPEVLNASFDQSIVVKTPYGQARSVPIVGLVHDPGLAPAWQEQEGYGYVTPATLVWLGESGQLDELKFRVSAQPFDAAAIEHTAQRLAVWLQTQGHPVQEIQIPPPGRDAPSSEADELAALSAPGV